MYSTSSCILLGDFYDGQPVVECARACSSMDIAYGFPITYKAKNGSQALTTMYFNTFVPVLESIPAFPSSSLFAEIGGYTGLLMGFSFLDFTRLLRFTSERVLKLGGFMARTGR